jgi:hypothetical protein
MQGIVFTLHALTSTRARLNEVIAADAVRCEVIAADAARCEVIAAEAARCGQ